MKRYTTNSSQQLPWITCICLVEPLNGAPVWNLIGLQVSHGPALFSPAADPKRWLSHYPLPFTQIISKSRDLSEGLDTNLYMHRKTEYQVSVATTISNCMKCIHMYQSPSLPEFLCYWHCYSFFLWCDGPTQARPASFFELSGSHALTHNIC